MYPHLSSTVYLHLQCRHVATPVPIVFCVLAMCAAAECNVENSNKQSGTACKCLPGFEGDIIWSGDTTTAGSICTAATCTGLVDQFFNGNVVKSNANFHGSVATFTCNDGFIITGTESITCDAPSTNTSWPAAPICVGVLCEVALNAVTRPFTN